MGVNHPITRVLQLNSAGEIDSDAQILTSPREIGALVTACIAEMVERGDLCNPRACGGSEHAEECNVNTRLSLSRQRNLMRLGTDMFAFTGQLPLAPGESKTWHVPAYPIGRVIENLFFRPTMAQNGQIDQIMVEITGEDGVLWSRFTGGRHNTDTGCCLLEFFQEDCIGWGEGFNFRLTHTGAVGQPAMISATADWNYLYQGQSSTVRPKWCWPKNARRRC